MTETNKPIWSFYGMSDALLQPRPIGVYEEKPFALDHLPAWIDEYCDEVVCEQAECVGNA